jgi:predicted nucleic acid-binding protein
MKYVLDAAVALKWVLPETNADKAKRLRDDHENQIHELIAPNVFAIETAHALVRAERRKIIPIGQAAALVVDVMNSSPILVSYLPLMSRAIDIASQMRCGVYDCLYVALAEKEGCELVTADDKPGQESQEDVSLHHRVDLAALIHSPLETSKVQSCSALPRWSRR